MPQPTISVLLPVFNGAKYIAEAMDSILAQTAGDFELIVVEGGSTDGTQEILRGYAAKDSRVKIITTDKIGIVESLNDGLRHAVGEWIARMDADDISLPNRFARQLDWLKTTGADMAGSWFKVFGAGSDHVAKHPETDEAVKTQLLFDVPFGHPTVMMRASLVRELGGYKRAGTEEVAACEDYDLWERGARAGWKMTNVQEVLLMYRQHPGQISAARNVHMKKGAMLVRRRRWDFVSDLMGLKAEWFDELFKAEGAQNMDVVDAAFSALVKGSQGESRKVVLEHAKETYFKSAAHCPDASSRWSKLNALAGMKVPLGEKIRLSARVLRKYYLKKALGLLRVPR